MATLPISEQISALFDRGERERQPAYALRLDLGSKNIQARLRKQCDPQPYAIHCACHFF
jgi:hypothetical protein